MKPLLLAAAFAVCAVAAPPLPGGFSDADPKSSEVKAAAAFAVKAAAAAKPDGTDKAPEIRLKSIVAARAQVVAGINYQLHLRVRSNGTEREADATVWWQPWRRPDPFQLTAWKWREAAAAENNAAAEAKPSPEKPPARPR
jgi:hypothetical protein